MAVRGVVATIDFYAANYSPGDSPLYSYQNYFPATRTIDGVVYEHNSFQLGDISKARDAAPSPVNVIFAGTAANVDLVEAACANRYSIEAFFWRWSAAEDLEDPADFDVLAQFYGDAIGGSADISTVTLNLGHYTSSLNGDMPWRKIPWTILGPLSFRR